MSFETSMHLKVGSQGLGKLPRLNLQRNRTGLQFYFSLRIKFPRGLAYSISRCCFVELRLVTQLKDCLQTDTVFKFIIS
jgi:hypothetical protein